MDLGLYLKGFIMGFSIAAPVGPVGLLCIRRTLANGRLSGFVSGLGAATADGIYGLIAGFGLTFVAAALVEQQFWLRLIGGAFLIYLGARTFLAHPAAEPAALKASGLWMDYFSTLAVTLTNPLTILAFAAVFAGLGFTSGQRYDQSVVGLVLGVFSGSAAWWLLLSLGVSLLRSRVTLRGLQWVNWSAGVLIVGFGLVALWSAWKMGGAA